MGSRNDHAQDAVDRAIAAIRTMVETRDRRGTVLAAQALDDALLSAGTIDASAFTQLQEVLELPEFAQSRASYAVLRAIEGGFPQLSGEQRKALLPVLRRTQVHSEDELARSISWDLLQLCRGVGGA